MLSLNPQQMEALAERQAVGFAARLLSELTRQFPSLMEPLPVFVRAAMVCNGLDQAEALGFSLEKTLGMFVALQCETAPDFFYSERVRPLLDSQNDDEVARMTQLLRDVPEEIWTQIKRGADLRAWFEPFRPEQRPARIAMQVCTAFPELVRQFPEANLRPFFEGIAVRGSRYDIDTDSGLCVYAAAWVFPDSQGCSATEFQQPSGIPRSRGGVPTFPCRARLRLSNSCESGGTNTLRSVATGSLWTSACRSASSQG